MKNWHVHYGVEFGSETNYIMIEKEVEITAVSLGLAKEIAADMAFDYGIEYLISMGYSANSESLRNMTHDGIKYRIQEILK